MKEDLEDWVKVEECPTLSNVVRWNAKNCR